MSEINKTTLEYYGRDFQYEAVKALIEEPDLFGELYKILNQNCFSDVWLKPIVGVMKDIYKETGMVPNYKEIRIKLLSKTSSEEDMQYYDESLERIKKSQGVGVETIKNELREFFRRKYRLAAVNEYMKDKSFDDKSTKKLKKKLEDAEGVGYDGSVTSTINEETIFRTLTEGEENVVPTFIKGLDERIAGGLGKGEIGLFMAPTGAGKTTFGTVVAHNAAVGGYKVLQVFFEDTIEDIIRKHLTIETGIYRDKLKGYDEEKARRLVENAKKIENLMPVGENLRLCRMLDRQTTVDDIENKIKELSNMEGFRTDVIVIDYFSCLKASKTYNLQPYQSEANTMRELVALAVKYGIAVWVLQQTNRLGLGNGSGANPSNWQGSIEATQPSSVFMELRKSEEQSRDGYADIAFHKTRHSKPLGKMEDIIYNNGLLRIDCSIKSPTEETLEYIEQQNPKSYKFQY